MPDIKQTVTRSEEQGLDSDGASVRQETKQVHTESAIDKKTTVQNIIWYILGVVEIVLTFRFILKLLGANSTSSFVNFIYSTTKALTAPFDSIFGVTSATLVQFIPYSCLLLW